MLGVWLKEISELVLPSVGSCKLCYSRRRPGRNPDLCCICEKELDYWEQVYSQCLVCGRYICRERDNPCPKCSQSLPLFARAVAVGPYRGILKESLSSLKFRGDRDLVKPMALLLANKIRSKINLDEIDLIIPVPMHHEKLVSRGFNQAELLAREVGRVIRKPAVNNILQKKESTPAQTHLHQKDRAANLKGSFCVPECSRLKGAGVLLVDDIFTTGNTAEECTRSLLSAGAKIIYVATVATGIYFSSRE
jgi:competence protein ComFC